MRRNASRLGEYSTSENRTFFTGFTPSQVPFAAAAAAEFTDAQMSNACCWPFSVTRFTPLRRNVSKFSSAGCVIAAVVVSDLRDRDRAFARPPRGAFIATRLPATVSFDAIAIGDREGRLKKTQKNAKKHVERDVLGTNGAATDRVGGDEACGQRVFAERFATGRGAIRS